MDELDEIDQFIINSCIRGVSFEQIAISLKYDERKMAERIESLDRKGIKVFTGMEGKVLRERDFLIFELIKQGKSPAEISKILNIKTYLVKEAIENFEKLNIRINQDEEQGSRQQSEYVEQQSEEPKENSDEDPQENQSEKQKESKAEVNKKIKTLYEQGMSQADIGKKLGYSSQEISRRIGIMRKKGENVQRKKPIEVQSEKVYELVKEGLSIDEIATRLNIGRKSVQRSVNYLKKQGINAKPKRKPREKEFVLDDLDKKILELRAQELSYDKIAVILKKTKLTIFNRVKRMREHNVEGSEIDLSQRGLKEQRNLEIAELYQSGMTAPELGKKFGLTEARVRVIIREHGVKKAKQNKLKNPVEKAKRDSEVVELYKNGMTTKQIAKKLNIGATTVSRILKQNGVACRKRIKSKVKRNPVENASEEDLRQAIQGLIESRHPTESQLEVIAEHYKINMRDIKKLAKYLDEREI